jgi:acetyl-CoA carboxylase carboxyl transferase subunit alpha
MRLADRFRLPVITLVDTTGAYPGVGAEERGQAEAIARSIETCLTMEVPVISVVIGEGGSGGAIALAAANTVLMLEHSIYSVIAPEACSSILWRSVDQARDAAEALRLTANDMLGFGVIDQIIMEPVGGAHRSPAVAVGAVGDAVERALIDLSALDGAMLRAQRREKFLNIDGRPTG